MQNLDQIIHNFLMMFMMKSDNIDFTQLFIPAIIFIIIQAANTVKPYAKRYLETKFRKGVEQTLNSVTTIPNVKGFIRFIRDYDENSKEHEVTDAVINRISKNDRVLKLVYRDKYVFDTFDDVEIENDLFVRLDRVDVTKTRIEKIEFRVFSHSKTLTELREWVKGCWDEYQYNKTFGFSEKQYYFNEVFIPTEHRNIVFNQTLFQTNKSLDNLYGKYIEQIKDRLNIFLNHPEWYSEKGLPHSFGMLLSGIPGCGKTSVIKAIANATKRHIFNVRLTKHTRATQLRNLFLSNEVFFQKANNEISFIEIPMNQRIIIFEDVDALSDILLSRKFIKPKKKTKQEMQQREMLGDDRYEQQQLLKDELTLSDILNLLDGVLEQPGRIVIFTTNHPEKLDSAFLRPGRIDMNIKFTNCDEYTLQQFFTRYFVDKVDYDFSELQGYFSPALVQEVLLQNLSNSKRAYERLCELKEEEPEIIDFPPEEEPEEIQHLDEEEEPKENNKLQHLIDMGIDITDPNIPLALLNSVRVGEGQLSTPLPTGSKPKSSSRGYGSYKTSY
jgi:hypothetical protein